MSKKYKKVCMALNYIEQLLALASSVAECNLLFFTFFFTFLLLLLQLVFL